MKTPKTFYRLLAGALLLPLLLVACSDDKPTGNPGDVILTPEVKAVLQYKLDSARVAAGIPGASIALKLPNGEEWYTSVGYERLTSAPNNVSAGDTMPIDAQFRIGSITKTFTATVVLQLIGEGMLTLDTKVTDILPDLSMTIVDLDTVTVRQLLNHTSSIQNYTNSIPWTLSYLINPTREWTPRELIDTANTLGPATAADYSPYPWLYANTNYIILGLIIEKLTGNSAKDEITTRVINRVGMPNTYFADVPEVPATVARGYSNFSCQPYDLAPIPGKGDTLYDITVLNPSQGWTAGSIISNTRDLIKYVDALVDGTLVTPQMQVARLTNMIPAGKDGAEGLYGLGIAKIAVNWIGHKGGFNGYDLSMYKKPGTAALVVLTSIGGTSCSVNTGGPILFRVITEYLFDEAPDVRAFDIGSGTASAN